MPTSREPSDAERLAIQRAVDSGDLRRARELIAGVRRRLSKSNGSGPKAQPNGKPKRVRPASVPSRVAVRTVGGTRYARCPRCGREISVNRDGLLRTHKAKSGGVRCRASRTKAAKALKGSPASVRTVSGGLPGSGKRS